MTWQRIFPLQVTRNKLLQGTRNKDQIQTCPIIEHLKWISFTNLKRKNGFMQRYLWEVNTNYPCQILNFVSWFYFPRRSPSEPLSKNYFTRKAPMDGRKTHQSKSSTQNNNDKNSRTHFWDQNNKDEDNMFRI